MTRTTCWLSLALLAWVGLTPVLHAANQIDADPKKNYTITKKHGPWMIMVTSLRGDDAESVTAANKAARDLVLELRQKGIPAYVHQQSGELEEISSVDRSGKQVRRYIASQRNRVCVLAGNYSCIDDEKAVSKQQKADADLANKTLQYVQSLSPKALEKGTYKPTPGRPGPLSRAFLTLNPLLSQDEVNTLAYQNDALLKQLNNDREYNLLENQGKYSLVVATFQGNSKHVVTAEKKVETKALLDFDKYLEKHISLDKAGQDAWTLVRILREQEKIEAYVFHERYRSVVTVGSFDDANDPRIPKLVEKFCAKVKRDPRTNQEVTVAEIVQIKGEAPKGATQPYYLFDPFPQVIRVPRLPK